MLYDVVRHLVEVGAVQDQASNQRATSLFIEAENGHFDVVLLWVDIGADKDKARDKGATPWLIAAQNGHLDVVRHLVEAGTDKDKASNNGATPLFIAAQNGHLDVVRHLVEVGAEIDKAVGVGTWHLNMVIRNLFAFWKKCAPKSHLTPEGRSWKWFDATAGSVNGHYEAWMAFVNLMNWRQIKRSPASTFMKPMWRDWKTHGFPLIPYNSINSFWCINGDGWLASHCRTCAPRSKPMLPCCSGKPWTHKACQWYFAVAGILRKIPQIKLNQWCVQGDIML